MCHSIRTAMASIAFVVAALLPGLAMAGHWGPNSGYSETNKDYTYNSFVFNANKFDAGSTGYEHETHVVDQRYVYPSWYWESNLPSPYMDCGNTNDPYDNFAIGSCANKSIKPNYSYYTYYDLNGQDSRVTSSWVETWGGQTYKLWWCAGWRCSCDCMGGKSPEDYVRLKTYMAPGWVNWRR